MLREDPSGGYKHAGLHPTNHVLLRFTQDLTLINDKKKTFFELRSSITWAGQWLK